jgi:hypothetical protein
MANPSSAKQMHDYGCGGYGTNWANNGSRTNPCYNTNTMCGGWRWNPWYGMVTYIPCGANVYSPYGYRYYNPMSVMRVYYVPPAPTYNNGNFGAFNGSAPSYASMGQTSAGYSGAMSTSTSSVSSSSTAAASSGTTSSGSSGSSGAGHGAGGHGR